MDVRCPPPRLVRPVRVNSGPGTPSRGEARGSRWRRTAPGTYVPVDVPRTVEQRILEEWWRVPGSVVSGWAACRLYGAGYLDGVDERGAELPVPLVVAPEQSPRAGSGARIVRQPLAPDHRARVQGVAVPTPGRAMVEAARLADDREAAVVALEMAYAAGVALPEWVRAALHVAPPRGLRQVRDAVSVAGTRSCSPPETRLRLVCLTLGRDPLVNIEVFDHDGRFLARPDLLDVERGLAIEYDGAMRRSRERRWTLERPRHAVRWTPQVEQLRTALARAEVS